MLPPFAFDDPPPLFSVLLQADSGRVANVLKKGKAMCPKDFIYHVNENNCIAPQCTFPQTSFNGTCITLPISPQISGSLPDTYSFLFLIQSCKAECLKKIKAALNYLTMGIAAITRSEVKDCLLSTEVSPDSYLADICFGHDMVVIIYVNTTYLHSSHHEEDSADTVIFPDFNIPGMRNFHHGPDCVHNPGKHGPKSCFSQTVPISDTDSINARIVSMISHIFNPFKFLLSVSSTTQILNANLPIDSAMNCASGKAHLVRDAEIIEAKVNGTTMQYILHDGVYYDSHNVPLLQTYTVEVDAYTMILGISWAYICPSPLLECAHATVAAD